MAATSHAGVFRLQFQTVMFSSSFHAMAPNDSSPCNAFFRYYLLVWGCLALLMAGLLLGGVGPKDFLLSESGPI